MHDVILAVLVSGTNGIWLVSLHKLKYAIIMHCKQVIIEQPELKLYSVTNSAFSFLTKCSCHWPKFLTKAMHSCTYMKKLRITQACNYKP
jgi:hypothetical protein